MIVLDLTGERHAAAHLLAALRAHRRWAKIQGYALPAPLEQLEQLAVAALEPSDTDSNRQAPTELRESRAEPVSLAPMTCSVPEAAAAIGVSMRSIERRVRSGEIASTKVGGSRRIPRRELERLGGAATTSEKEA